MSDRGAAPEQRDLETGQRRRRVAAALLTSSLLSLTPGWSSALDPDFGPPSLPKSDFATGMVHLGIETPGASLTAGSAVVDVEPLVRAQEVVHERSPPSQVILTKSVEPVVPIIPGSAPLSPANASEELARAVTEPLSLLPPGRSPPVEPRGLSIPVLALTVARSSPAYVDQITVAEHSVQVPQLHAPGTAAASAEPLADQIAAMQVQLPPLPILSEDERAALLVAAPETMTLRVGDAAAGQVSFRMTDNRTISVQLSGLLDILSDNYTAAEFERLRGSAAADSYVEFDELRSLGLKISYDPVYDELRLSA